MDGSSMTCEAGGEYLVTLRRLEGLRQEDVASALKVAERTMSRWENGSNRPSTKRARTLMKVLKGSLDSFLELWEDEKATRADAVSRAAADRETALLLEAIKTEDDLDALIRAYRQRHPRG